MTKIVAFDSTLYRRGTVNPFTSPLGVGLVPRDPAASAAAVTGAFEGLSRVLPALRTRPFWSSVHLFRKAPKVPALELLERIVRPVLATIDVVSLSYSTTRLDRITTHGLTQPREVGREGFMSNLQQDYVFHSLWKFGLYHDMTQYHAILDGMNPIVTGGSLRVATYDFEVVFHGDEVDPLVCAADLVAKYIDAKLASMPDPDHRYPTAPINEATVSEVLRGSGVKLFPMVIGTRDFHFVTPLRTGGGGRVLPIRHPIVFLVREPPPPEMGKFPRTGLDAFEGGSEIADFVVKRAFERRGCWKRWDNADLVRFDESQDELVHYGPVGEKMAAWLVGARPTSKVVKFESGGS